MKETILVTGAAGFIGGTFTYEALKKGYRVHGIDNFSNSTDRNITIFKTNFSKDFTFSEIDLAANIAELRKIFEKFKPSVVIHFAGLKAIGESEVKPELYWKNNVESTHNLLRCCKQGIKFIFSSSATVYGKSSLQPVKENFPVQSNSVYASTKIASELLIKDYSRSKKIKSICLRYFNPLGTHAEGLITENYKSNLSNLMPNIIRNLLNQNKVINIYGDDYETFDGTCERDFIHIMDLVEGHFASMRYTQDVNFKVFNLGTGKATSVLKLIETFNSANNTNLRIAYAKRRKGDVSACYADPTLANDQLGWKAKRSIKKMCVDAWKPVK